nr:unnamed protein product [Spirometra erinaceieuropaei]
MRSTKATALPPPKSNVKRTSPSCVHPATASNVSIVSTDILGTNWTCWTPSDQLHHSDRTNRRPSVHLLLVLLRRQLTLTAILNHRSHPLPLPPPLLPLLLLPLLLLLLLVLRCPNGYLCGVYHAHQQKPTPLPSTPVVRTSTTPLLTATAPSPHTSAWSATCKSIAQRP